MDLDDCTLVLRNNGKELFFYDHGLNDLYALFCHQPELLGGAEVTDRIVGMGAAIILLYGGVSRVITPIISESALELLEQEGVWVDYEEVVPYILNRARTSLSRMEEKLRGIENPDELLEALHEAMREELV